MFVLWADRPAKLLSNFYTIFRSAVNVKLRMLLAAGTLYVVAPIKLDLKIMFTGGISLAPANDKLAVLTKELLYVSRLVFWIPLLHPA